MGWLKQLSPEYKRCTTLKRFLWMSLYSRKEKEAFRCMLNRLQFILTLWAEHYSVWSRKEAQGHPSQKQNTATMQMCFRTKRVTFPTSQLFIPGSRLVPGNRHQRCPKYEEELHHSNKTILFNIISSFISLLLHIHSSYSYQRIITKHHLRLYVNR